MESRQVQRLKVTRAVVSALGSAKFRATFPKRTSDTPITVVPALWDDAVADVFQEVDRHQGNAVLAVLEADSSITTVQIARSHSCEWHQIKDDDYVEIHPDAEIAMFIAMLSEARHPVVVTVGPPPGQLRLDDCGPDDRIAILD